MRMMSNLAHELGRAVVIVTHDARVLEFADRTVRIEDGLIVQNSTETEIPAGMLAYPAQPNLVATA